MSPPFQLYYVVLSSHVGLIVPLVISEIANEKYSVNEYCFIPAASWQDLTCSDLELALVEE